MKSKKLTAGLFYLYLLALVWIILFKMQFSFHQFGLHRSINLIPFAQSVIINDRLDFREIIDNVLIFIPFGIFVCMLGKGRYFWTAGIKQQDGLNLPSCCCGRGRGKIRLFLSMLAPVFFTSLALETMQYIFAAGASDITDLITNTAGGMAGICIFGMFSCIWKEKAFRIVNVCMSAGAACMVLLVVILIAAN